MDFENMMVTPVMYQDIPSSFMMQPMMLPMYGGMYPSYGVGQLQPALPNDKFQKLETKNQESKQAIKKTAITLALLTAAGIFISKKFKPDVKLFAGTRAKISSGFKSAKTGITNGVKAGWNKFTGLFKKKTT